jgi:hypothetical protein
MAIRPTNLPLSWRNMEMCHSSDKSSQRPGLNTMAAHVGYVMLSGRARAATAILHFVQSDI